MLGSRGFSRVLWSCLALAALSLAPLGVASAQSIERFVSVSGSDVGDCSSLGSPCLTINYAITQALAGDTIKITEGVFTGSGTEVVLINKSLSLSGGWDPAFTEQVGLTTIDGQTVRRGITATDGTVVTLDRFLVRNGFHINQGGGISSRGTLTVNNSLITANWSQWMGGGINMYGTLVVNDSVISQNKAGRTGYSGGGGGAGIEVYGASTATINRTSLVGNQIIGSFFGSAVDGGRVVVNDSTVSGNSGAVAFSVVSGRLTLNNTTVSSNRGYELSWLYSAGAIDNSSGQVVLNNSTVTGNSATLGVGGIVNRSASPPSLVTLNNSIVAGNTGKWATDCYGKIGSSGYNILGSSYGCTFTPGEGDQVGTPANPINPLLLPLDNYGGPLPTSALRPDSPAHGAGNPATPGSGGNACLATDQRGFDRIDQGRCDIGAYQIQRPAVEAITRLGPSPTDSGPVDFSVAFTDPVTGVDSSDFQLTTTGIDGATITSVSGSGADYVVSVDVGTATGTVRLDLVDDDSILDGLDRPLGGAGLKNGDYAFGESYTILGYPIVTAITRLDPTPTTAADVDFALTFAWAVTGVDPTDFRIVSDGVNGAAVSEVSGSGAAYTVHVQTGSGIGTLRLDLVDDDSIVDESGRPLAGPGLHNGDFVDGEAYQVNRLPSVVSITALDPIVSRLSSVRYAVKFSWDVTNVDMAPPFSDFALTTDLGSATITSVTGSGADYVVTIDTSTGNVILRLDLLDDDSILDIYGTPLGGAGSGNGDFVTGDLYMVVHVPIPFDPSTWITDNTPTYSWRLVPDGERYQYQVLKDGDAIFKKTVFADECGEAICYDTPPKALKPGYYTWAVKVMLDGAWEDWSPEVEFRVLGD